MTDYSELVEALRTVADYVNCYDCEMWGLSRCDQSRKSCVLRNAAAAIEVLQAEQKKTVTQIFCEEQMAWEGRCKDLMKHISDLQAEVERLKDSNEELREAQTYIDHYGDKWRTSAKDVPTSAYNHGYMDGKNEAEQAGEPKRGEWIMEEGAKFTMHPLRNCSVCGAGWFGVSGYNYCPSCGAKMTEVQE